MEKEIWVAEAARILGGMRADAQAIDSEKFREKKLRQIDRVIELFDAMLERIEDLERETKIAREQLAALRKQSRPAHLQAHDLARIAAGGDAREKARRASIEAAMENFPNLYYGPGNNPERLTKNLPRK